MSLLLVSAQQTTYHARLLTDYINICTELTRGHIMLHFLCKIQCFSQISKEFVLKWPIVGPHLKNQFIQCWIDYQVDQACFAISGLLLLKSKTPSSNVTQRVLLEPNGSHFSSVKESCWTVLQGMMNIAIASGLLPYGRDYTCNRNSFKCLSRTGYE